MRPTILSCVFALAACGKSEPAKPTAEPATAEPAAATPAPAAKKAKVKGLPPGPATILAVNAYDPCSLVPDDVLKKLFGGAPTGMRRERLNSDALRRDDESAIRCEWRLDNKTAEVRFGSEHSTSTIGNKRQEEVPGLGESAWMEKGSSGNILLRVKVGDRYLRSESDNLGDEKAVAVALATAAVAALPTVAQLSDKLRAGDLVGAPAIKPCELMSAEALAAAAGAGDFVTLPDERTGYGKIADDLSCEWITQGERSAKVRLRAIGTWEDVVQRAPSGPSVAGHEARFTSALDEELYVKMDGWTLVVGVNDVDTPRADKQARLLVLAEAVLARLPR